MSKCAFQVYLNLLQLTDLPKKCNHLFYLNAQPNRIESFIPIKTNLGVLPKKQSDDAGWKSESNLSQPNIPCDIYAFLRHSNHGNQGLKNLSVYSILQNSL